MLWQWYIIQMESSARYSIVTKTQLNITERGQRASPTLSKVQKFQSSHDTLRVATATKPSLFQRREHLFLKPVLAIGFSAVAFQLDFHSKNFWHVGPSVRDPIADSKDDFWASCGWLERGTVSCYRGPFIIGV